MSEVEHDLCREHRRDETSYRIYSRKAVFLSVLTAFVQSVKAYFIFF
jgi:hypothetical protein